MAECRREGEEELRDILDIRNRNQATDRPERTKPDHLHSSQGPLSSIRAAIKRSERPEITILSAEPLGSTSWYPSASAGFPSPPPSSSQTNWNGSITTDTQLPPTYDQVIKEKTQEEHGARPTATPRRSTTIATQTDPVWEDTPAAGLECPAALQPITERNSAVKKLPRPQKPPRPSPPQPLQSGPTSGTSPPKPKERVSTSTTSTTSTSTDGLGGPPSAAVQQAPREPCRALPDSPHPSVTVQWDVPATPLSPAIDSPVPPVLLSLTPSDATPAPRPTPLPRTKARKHPIAEEVKVQTLVRLSDNGVSEGVTQSADAEEDSSDKYLRELLDVFHTGDRCEPSADSAEQSYQSEDRGNEMSSLHSQRNIRARIQAFESQVEDGIEELATPPEPSPKNAHLKPPPIAAKPSLAPKPSFKRGNQQNVTNGSSYQDSLNSMFSSLNPTPAARPVPPKPPLDLSLSDPEPAAPLATKDSYFSTAPEHSLPPRPAGGRVLPSRPPSAKAGPGRPPPPRLNSTSRASSFHGTSGGPQPRPPQQQAQSTRGRGASLPPRPGPGHPLYNKYTFETPHGIASCDYNGSGTGELSFQKNEVLLILGQIDHQTFECQLGGRKGPVQESYMKVITPLSSYSAQPAPPPAQQGSSSPAGHRRDRCGLQVQALHDFNPEGPGELALWVGDVVSMVEEVDSEWYQGTCRGSLGFFPVSYVKVLIAKPPTARVSGPRCLARFDFEGERSNELSFSEGDVIQLKEYLGDDWARGQMGAYSGIFPLNFVEVVEDLPSPRPAQQKTSPSKIALPGMAASPISQTAAKLAKPIQAAPPAAEWAVALYDFSGESEEDLSFQQGDHILVTQHLDADWWSGRLNGREGFFPVAFVGTSAGQSPTVVSPKSRGAGGLRAKALFDFQSNCDEELSFQVGDTITNLESVDGQWFLGDLRGQRALVPKNYVQVTS
ncbi:SH3 domain-containing protein 19 [Aplochiton taeniatus]